MQRATILLAAVGLMVMTMGGCEELAAPQQRLAYLQGWLTTATAQTTNLEVLEEVLRQNIAQNEALLSDPNLPVANRQEILEVLAKAKTQLETVSAKKTELMELATKAKAEIERIMAAGEVALGDELQLYGQGGMVVGSKIPGEPGMWVTLGAGVVYLIGSVLNQLKQAKTINATTADKANLETALSGVVNSVNKLLQDRSIIADPKAAIEVLKAEQGPVARATVQRIKGETVVS